MTRYADAVWLLGVAGLVEVAHQERRGKGTVIPSGFSVCSHRSREAVIAHMGASIDAAGAHSHAASSPKMTLVRIAEVPRPSARPTDSVNM